jgi:hypothetical protein
VAFQPHEGGPINPELTANFLSCQENVLSAHAWTKGESVLARVTVTQDACITETDLLNACLNTIGIRHTPKAIWLDRRARPAA